jgi:predicted nucleic acid-binding protein
MSATQGLVRHDGKVWMTEQERKHFVVPIPERITDLLDLARTAESVMYRETVDHTPCSTLHELYFQYKVACADAIKAEERGTPIHQLTLADRSVEIGESETLLEGWIRAGLKLEGEQVAQRMLVAAHAQQNNQPRVLLPMGKHLERAA